VKIRLPADQIIAKLANRPWLILVDVARREAIRSRCRI
jgi:hypothetical protein